MELFTLDTYAGKIVILMSIFSSEKLYPAHLESVCTVYFYLGNEKATMRKPKVVWAQFSTLR
jgi:hypothetical protein